MSYENALTSISVTGGDLLKGGPSNIQNICDLRKAKSSDETMAKAIRDSQNQAEKPSFKENLVGNQAKEK